MTFCKDLWRCVQIPCLSVKVWPVSIRGGGHLCPHTRSNFLLRVKGKGSFRVDTFQGKGNRPAADLRARNKGQRQPLFATVLLGHAGGRQDTVSGEGRQMLRDNNVGRTIEQPRQTSSGTPHWRDYLTLFELCPSLSLCSQCIPAPARDLCLLVQPHHPQQLEGLLLPPTASTPGLLLSLMPRMSPGPHISCGCSLTTTPPCKARCLGRLLHGPQARTKQTHVLRLSVSLPPLHSPVTAVSFVLVSDWEFLRAETSPIPLRAMHTNRCPRSVPQLLPT